VFENVLDRGFRVGLQLGFGCGFGFYTCSRKNLYRHACGSPEGTKTHTRVVIKHVHEASERLKNRSIVFYSETRALNVVGHECLISHHEI
jgi:hypothetical protein